MPEIKQTILLDLDGTLADTAEDLTLSLNQVLTEHGSPTLPIEKVRPVISQGSTAMLRLGLEFIDGSEQHIQLKQRLFDLYTARNHDCTDLFAGMEECLITLEQRGYQWGIVTNKLLHVAEPLIKKLKLNKRICCLVCGDTTPHAKPHPAPLLHAAKLAQTEPENCIYIGDALNDVIAAKHAKMTAIVAAYGYIPKQEDLESWQADSIIESPEEFISWLRP